MLSINVAITIAAVLCVVSLAYWVWKYYYNIPQQEIKFAKHFFTKNSQNKYRHEDIMETKKIHNGFTNLSFYIKTKDNLEWQLRFAKNSAIVDRKNEAKIIKLLNKQDFLYLDQYGNYIKKWIVGRNIIQDDINDEFMNKLKHLIKQFHNINLQDEQILKNDYESVQENKKIKNKFIEKYNEYLPILNNQDWVFSHNDLNFDNVLLTENKEIKFIDFEWCRINHPNWDIVNFCRESKFSFESLKNVSKKFNIEFDEFMKHYYICLCFAYDWTFKNKFSFKILKYRIKTYFQINKTLKYLKILKI